MSHLSSIFLRDLELYKLLIFISTSFIIIFILIFYSNKVCLKFNILDYPNRRKSHHKPISLSGGIVIFFGLLIFCIISITTDIFKIDFYIDIIIYSSIFFIFGLYDDLKQPNTVYKVFLIIVFILSILFYSEVFVLYNLQFKYLNYLNTNLSYLSIPFTVFCIFMFFNALNYSDGKNGISISYSVYLTLYFVFYSKIETTLLVYFILMMIILLIFNLRNVLFLGNNGINFISIFLSLYLIKSYNLNLIEIYCDEILLLMYLPGLDAARVTITRIINKISPFKPDRIHFHHKLEFYFSDNYIWIFNLIVGVLPIFILKFTNNFYLSFILSTLIYIIFLTRKFPKFS